MRFFLYDEVFFLWSSNQISSSNPYLLSCGHFSAKVELKGKAGDKYIGKSALVSEMTRVIGWYQWCRQTNCAQQHLVPGEDSKEVNLGCAKCKK